MSSSSCSDSDSDKEPNSHGARVFWGNVKTPERSRSNFVNPPKTVVKSSKLSQLSRPTKISLVVEDDVTAQRSQGERSEGDDRTTPNFVHPHDLVTTAEGGTMDVDTERKDTVDSYESESTSFTIPPLQPSLFLSQTRSADIGSESEVEDAPVLQLSSPVDSRLVVLGDSTHTVMHDPQEVRVIVHSRSVSPVSFPSEPASNAPRASQRPGRRIMDDLLTTPPYSTQSETPFLPHSDPIANNIVSSSSGTATDELPIQLPQDSSLSPAHFHSSGPQSAAFIPSPSSPVTESSSIKERIIMDTCSSSQHLTLPVQYSRTTVSQIDLYHIPQETPLDAEHTGNMPSQTEIITNTSTKLDDTPHPQTTDAAGMQTPRCVRSIMLHAPGAETRRRSTTSPRKGKEKADDDAGSSREAFLNSLNGSNELLAQVDEETDKSAKKERRVKAKEQAERRRPLLMSLSPTSVDVLNLLASPGRASLSPSRLLEDVITDIPLQFNVPINPQTRPSTPARRIPIPVASNRKQDDPPPHFIRPSPVPLNDPNRTPCRRVFLTETQTPSRPLPLDDPNRTPARRIAIPLSPEKHNRTTAATPGAQSCDVEGNTSGIAPSSKETIQSPPPRVVEQDDGSKVSSSRITSHIPFPIVQPPGSKSPGVDWSVSSSRLVAPTSLLKPLSLKQPSSTSTSKIARAATQPYPHSKHLQSKLPKPSSSRLPVLGTGTGPTAGGAGLGKPNPPSAPLPTRIPSPVKRQAPSVDVPESAPASALRATSGAGLPVSPANGRKRQRTMAEEDDSDEPSAKRPMLVVHRVKKGMYNKPALAEPSVPGPSTSHRETSLSRLTRPTGPVQFRQVIPGTLRHFETARSSSRELFKAAEERRSKTLTPPRHGSPDLDADTASTVTTLSREPTLEDIPGSSSALESEPSFMTLSDPGPELRRTTRVRKPHGPDTLPPTPLAHVSATGRVPSLVRTSVVHRSASSSKITKSTTRTVKSHSVPTNPRQLRAITVANTIHNQAYVADLQRKIVRKPGPRPASPTTRVRTILEKAKADTARAREARAERRRRRGEGSAASINSDGHPLDDSEQPSSSPPRELVDRALDKHARGPGDDEEYETPVRVPKPSRLDPGKVFKSVKWDRGLARPISDFAAEQAAKRAKEGATTEVVRKGCLAHPPETLQLDPLGNVPDAYIPLNNLGRERVIVTRFVYDDDDDIEAARLAKKTKLRT